jgi:GxxExxY protein
MNPENNRNNNLRPSASSAVPPESDPAASTSASRDPETFAIIGAAMEVHRVLGHGFLEAVYQDALEREFIMRGIPYRREQPIPVLYKGHQLPSSYRADFVCHGAVIVELKAIKKLTEIEDAQILNYLKATGFKRALMFNFAAQRLEHKRFVNNYLRPSASSAVQTGVSK